MRSEFQVHHDTESGLLVIHTGRNDDILRNELKTGRIADLLTSTTDAKPVAVLLFELGYHQLVYTQAVIQAGSGVQTTIVRKARQKRGPLRNFILTSGCLCLTSLRVDTGHFIDEYGRPSQRNGDGWDTTKEVRNFMRADRMQPNDQSIQILFCSPQQDRIFNLGGSVKVDGRFWEYDNVPSTRSSQIPC